MTLLGAIVDDRGVRRKALREARRNPDSRLVLRQLRARLQRDQLAPLSAGGAIGFGVVARIAGEDALAWGLLAIGTLNFLFVVLPTRWAGIWSDESLADVTRRDCAVCGYDLRHLNLDSDGCVVCPECGAAWRVQ